jgi:hypothetical protein
MATKPIIVPVVVNDQTGQAFIQINEKMLQMKARASETMREMTSQTTEARHAAHLLGDELDTKIPRALQGILAKSTLLGPALAAAFPLIAGVAFLELILKLPEGIKKVSEHLMGWGEAAKKAYEEQIKLNEAALKSYEKHEELLKRIELIGLDGSAKLRKEQQQYQKELEETTASIERQSKAYEQLRAKASETRFVAGGTLSGSSRMPTDAAKLAQQELKDPAWKNYEKGIEELREKQQSLRDEIKKTEGDLKVTYKTETIEAFNKQIEKVLATQKQVDDVLKGIHERDAQAAAMMQLAFGDAKMIGQTLSVMSAAVKGPLEDMTKIADRLTKALEAEHAQEQAIIASSRTAGDSQLVAEQKLVPLRKQAVKDLQTLVAQYQAMAALSKDPALIEEAKKYGAELDKLKVKVQSLADVMKVDVKNQFKGAFTDIILQTKSVSEAFRQMAASIIADLVRMILEMYVFKAVSGILGGLFGGGASLAKSPQLGFLQLPSAVPVLGHASGGSFPSGMPMLVGELGPEIILPNTSGTVIPNSAFGRMGNVYNIDARGAQPGVELDIMRAIKASEDRAVVRSVRTLDSRAKRRS